MVMVMVMVIIMVMAKGDDDPGDGVAGDVEVSGGRDSRRLLSRLQSEFLNLRRWEVKNKINFFFTWRSSFGDPSRVDIWLIVQNGFIDCREESSFPNPHPHPYPYISTYLSLLLSLTVSFITCAQWPMRRTRSIGVTTIARNGQ